MIFFLNKILAMYSEIFWAMTPLGNTLLSSLDKKSKSVHPLVANILCIRMKYNIVG